MGLAANVNQLIFLLSIVVTVVTMAKFATGLTALENWR